MRAALERAILIAGCADPLPDREPLGGEVSIPASALERPTQDHTFREKRAWIEQAQATSARAGIELRRSGANHCDDPHLGELLGTRSAWGQGAGSFFDHRV